MLSLNYFLAWELLQYGFGWRRIYARMRGAECVLCCEKEKWRKLLAQRQEMLGGHNVARPPNRAPNRLSYTTSIPVPPANHCHFVTHTHWIALEPLTLSCWLSCLFRFFGVSPNYKFRWGPSVSSTAFGWPVKSIDEASSDFEIRRDGGIKNAVFISLDSPTQSTPRISFA